MPPMADGDEHREAGGIVLAGGRSSRMGTDKATLDWHGTPLVAHVAGAVARAVGGPVVVVAAPGQRLPALPFGIDVTRDAREGRGPLQGLVAGLDALDGRAGCAFVVATDMPFVAPPLVARLLAALRPDDDAAAVVAGGVVQPLGAVYRTRVAATAAELLAGERRSLTALLDAVRTRRLDGDALPATELAALRGVDTPEDYAAALRA